MSKADKMFKEFGYETSNEGNELFFYKGEETVVFFLEQKSCSFVDDWGYAINVDYRLHLAINQKMKELGWLDEE